MSKKQEVKSENQSGGITGFNLNVGNNTDLSNSKDKQSKKPINKFWKIIGYIAMIATIVAAIIAALNYFKI